jgi:hypothetical protein
VKLKSFVLTTGIAVSGIVASGAFAPAQAFTVFFGEDASAGGNVGNIPNSNIAAGNFLSNLSGSGTETFDGFTVGTTPSTITFPGIGSAGFAGVGSVQSANTYGAFPISASNYYSVSVAGTFTINFASPVAAFGFYGTDIGDVNGRLTLQLNDANNTLLTVPNTTTPSGSALYYGFIAGAGETFTSVTFGNTNGGNDFFGFDNLTVGNLAQVQSPTAVPEPFTIIGTLVGGTAALRMRKKLKASTKA